VFWQASRTGKKVSKVIFRHRLPWKWKQFLIQASFRIDPFLRFCGRNIRAEGAAANGSNPSHARLL